MLEVRREVVQLRSAARCVAMAATSAMGKALGVLSIAAAGISVAKQATLAVRSLFPKETLLSLRLGQAN